MTAAVAILVAVPSTITTCRPTAGSPPATTVAAGSGSADHPTGHHQPVGKSMPPPPTVSGDAHRRSGRTGGGGRPPDTPVRLSSPAEWDQWLPAGKPYPGTSTAEEMSTCPELTDRLGAALGARMSYWTGTLPGGRRRAARGRRPALNDGPYPPIPYLVSVGYPADGTTDSWSQHFYEHQGRAVCPDVDVPTAPGAALVRCVNDEVTSYSLVLPESAGEGVWSLEADTRPNAPPATSFVLTTLVDGVTAAFG